MTANVEASGPDFASGVALSELPAEGVVSGRVGDEPVLLSCFDGQLFAVSGNCTHYGASLASGTREGETVRCPLHHACFSLRTGEAMRAPALDPLDRWEVETQDDRVFVRRKMDGKRHPEPARVQDDVRRIVIVGGGGAGLACANELRRLGFAGSIAMLSADGDGPSDRPNLSKDFLAGTAPEEWLPLRSDDWYHDHRIDLRLDAEVQRVDVAGRTVRVASGEEFAFDRLLIATGSEPTRLNAPGFDRENVFTLRSVADARSIAARATPGANAVIIGSSFIGLEAAAALRKRKVEVSIVSLEHVPFQGVFGAELGCWMQRLHERNGVCFHLGTVAACFDDGMVRLADGSAIAADFVLIGIGVRPRIAVAKAAGIPGDGGVPVDAFLETCLSGIFAAGDVAEYPDRLTGERVRIEHWVTAERQGQVAAANMLGQKRPFDAVPFFWTEQYGVALRYVGHAVRWDRIEWEGSLESGEFIARYFDGNEHLASAAVGKDFAILEDERRFEQRIAEKRECAGTAQPALASN